MMKRLFPSIIFLLFVCPAWGQISGLVFDEDKTALPGASILLLPDNLSAITEVDGRFTFSGLTDGSYLLVVSFIGYETDTVSVKVKNSRSKNLSIRLQTSTTLLETIEVTEEHAKQEETLHTEHIHEDFFQKNLQGAFAKSIEKIARYKCHQRRSGHCQARYQGIVSQPHHRKPPGHQAGEPAMGQ